MDKFCYLYRGKNKGEFITAGVKYTQGFSLYEILVVVGVVMILVTFMVPMWGVVRSKSDQITCSNHLRSIAIAGVAWSSDNDGLLPDMGLWRSSKVSDQQYSFLEYLGYSLIEHDYDTVMTCPAFQKEYPSTLSMHVTYSINRYASSSRINQPEDFEKIEATVPKYLHLVQDTSKMAFFMDGRPRNLERTSLSETYYIDQNYLGISPEKTPYLHNEGIQVVFLDLHVERLLKEDVIGILDTRASIDHSPFWGRILK